MAGISSAMDLSSSCLAKSGGVSSSGPAPPSSPICRAFMLRASQSLPSCHKVGFLVHLLFPVRLDSRLSISSCFSIQSTSGAKYGYGVLECFS